MWCDCGDGANALFTNSKDKSNNDDKVQPICEPRVTSLMDPLGGNRPLSTPTSFPPVVPSAITTRAT